MQAQSSSSQASFNSTNFEKKNFNGLEKPKDVRRGNIISAKGNFKIKFFEFSLNIFNGCEFFQKDVL
jgi:hypothetical protein